MTATHPPSPSRGFSISGGTPRQDPWGPFSAVALGAPRAQLAYLPSRWPSASSQQPRERTGARLLRTLAMVLRRWATGSWEHGSSASVESAPQHRPLHGLRLDVSRRRELYRVIPAATADTRRARAHVAFVLPGAGALEDEPGADTLCGERLAAALVADVRHSSVRQCARCFHLAAPEHA